MRTSRTPTNPHEPTNRPLLRCDEVVSPAVALPARFVLFGADRLLLAFAHRGDAIGADAQADEILLHGGRTALEFKYDGARVQVHREGERVGIWTRRLSDVTRSLPDVVEVTRGLAGAPFILDGEVVALDAAGRPLPFQELMRRFRRVHGVEALVREMPLALHFFDCLMVDGRSLSKITQGVTTEIMGEAWTPAPFGGLIADTFANAFDVQDITAWAEPNGRLMFRPDIYGKDQMRELAGDRERDPDAPPPPRETLAP